MTKGISRREATPEVGVSDDGARYPSMGVVNDRVVELTNFAFQDGAFVI